MVAKEFTPSRSGLSRLSPLRAAANGSQAAGRLQRQAGKVRWYFCWYKYSSQCFYLDISDNCRLNLGPFLHQSVKFAVDARQPAVIGGERRYGSAPDGPCL